MLLFKLNNKKALREGDILLNKLKGAINIHRLSILQQNKINFQVI